MRKLLILIPILLCFCVSQSQAISPAVLGSVSGLGATASYTDITYWIGFEGTWSTPTYTLGADDYPTGSTATASSAVVIDGTGAIIGSNGLRNTSASDYMTATVTGNDIVNLDQSRVGFWLRIPTDGWAAMSVGHYTMQVYGDGNNFVSVLVVGTAANDIELTVTLRSGGSYDVSASTTALNMVENTAYFVELILDQAGNGCTLKVNGANSEIAADAYDAVATAATQINFGVATTPATIVHIDNLMVSNDVGRDLYALRSLTASPR